MAQMLSVLFELQFIERQCHVTACWQKYPGFDPVIMMKFTVICITVMKEPEVVSGND